MDDDARCRWFTVIGAALGAGSGIVSGFNSAGIGGAILGLFVGGWLGMLVGALGPLALGFALIGLLIWWLWGVGKP